jgi:hypothetical protein
LITRRFFHELRDIPKGFSARASQRCTGYEPPVFWFWIRWIYREQDHPLAGARRETSHCFGDCLHELPAWLYKVIRREHRHDRVGIPVEHVRQGKQDASGRVPLIWLEQDEFGRGGSQTLLHITLMMRCRDDDHSTPWYQHRCSMHGMFKHGPLSQECTELLWRLGAQAFADEFFKPLSLAPGQNNPPKILCSVRHGEFLPEPTNSGRESEHPIGPRTTRQTFRWRSAAIAMSLRFSRITGSSIQPQLTQCA